MSTQRAARMRGGSARARSATAIGADEPVFERLEELGVGPRSGFLRAQPGGGANEEEDKNERDATEHLAPCVVRNPRQEEVRACYLVFRNHSGLRASDWPPR